ncbi:MAG: DUF2339 domain-containing protein [Sandaracinaceae bacterium]|nr:DUF2339 domain-containing protein [Sandaracinaceae bacterium]
MSRVEAGLAAIPAQTVTAAEPAIERATVPEMAEAPPPEPVAEPTEGAVEAEVGADEALDASDEAPAEASDDDLVIDPATIPVPETPPAEVPAAAFDAVRAAVDGAPPRPAPVDPGDMAAAGPAPAAPPPAPPQRIAWEQWIGVRGAAALGASILVLAGIYFFEYSIEHGLITPAMRMVAGTLVGLGCLAASELRLRRTHEVLASWIAGAGIAILYLAFWAGQALYSLYPTWAAGILMVATTGVCTALAVYRRSMPVALLGLFGGFITPLALSTGSDRPLPLFGYLLLLDGAMLWVAYKRRWSWLAALCLIGTGIYQYSWLLARLDEPRLVLGVAIVGVFALLFGALPALRPEPVEGATAPEPESVLWRLTRSAGVLVPLLFTVPLAMRTDLGDTFAVTAVQLVLLCAAACFVGMRHQAVALPTGAALVSAFALMGRGLTHPPTTALGVWQPVGLAIGLLVVFAAFAELSGRLYPERRNVAVGASAYVLTLLSLATLAAPFAEAAGPWPWLVFWGVAGLAATRLSTLLGQPSLQVATAGLVAVGLGATFAATGGTDGQPPPAVLLAFIVGASVLMQLAGLLPFRSEDARRHGDHAAALLAVLTVPFLALADRLESMPVWVFYASTLALAVLALMAAARRGSAGWLAVIAAMTAGTHSLFVLRRHDGPFGIGELAVLLGSVVLFATFPVIAPKAMRDRPWAWRTAALVAPAYLLTLRHVYLDVLGPSTIGLLPVLLGIVSVGAASAVRLRGPEPAEARKVALVWLTASAAGFVTLAIPMQLDNEWITIGWALEALVLTGLWRRMDHAGLKYLALALGVAVGVRLLANPYVLGYYDRSELRVLNWLTYTYLVPAVCFVGAWLLLRGEEAKRLRSWEKSFMPEGVSLVANLAATAAILIVFAWINLTIFDWFATGEHLAIPTDRLPARDLTLSIAWAIYAIALLAIGMWRKSTALRVASLLLILVTAAKVFLYDLAHLADLYRVASLAGLAISLIVISLAYQRFVFRGSRPEEVRS